MNIFVLHENPEIASIMHVDKHVVKMPLETAQILCTAHWELGGNAPYKSTHRKHPCSTWVLQSIENYRWLVKLGLELCKEYTYRYDKIHKCEAIIEWCSKNEPNLPYVSMTSQPLCMPDNFKSGFNPVESYRNYYIGAKSHIHSWKNRQKPNWIN